MECNTPRIDRWLARQHWTVQFGAYCLRVLLIVAVICLINRAVS